MDEFEWDARKAEANLGKHGIDFEDAIEIFERTVLTFPSAYQAEQRFVSIGPMGGRIIAVIWTRRSGITRIISARRARHEEREAYRQSIGQ